MVEPSFAITGCPPTSIPFTNNWPNEPVEVVEPLMFPLAVTWPDVNNEFILASLPETMIFFQFGI